MSTVLEVFQSFERRRLLELSPPTTSPESNQVIDFRFDGNSYRTERVIGDAGCADQGPTLVFLGAIHGNEPTGVVALQRVFDEIARLQPDIHGRILGLSGNLSALSAGCRFIDEDLNRIWIKRRIQDEKDANKSVEARERTEIYEIIKRVLDGENEKHFFDLHTTSSPSVPFIAINDQLANREFAVQFPVATIFGIEEYIEGPLLSFLNDFGHVAFAFEAGQHTNPESVEIHAAFIKLALFYAGVIGQSSFFDFDDEFQRLKGVSQELAGFYEVVYRHAITEDEQFEMEPGFENFSGITKGQRLARNQKGAIPSNQKGRIFMPLYQSEGTDGFFVIRSIPRWALWLSKTLRRINFDRILAWLPGVRRLEETESLLVNKRVAFFLRNQLFHLLGYRRKQDSGTHVLFSRREIENP